jgi:hypothetical protein
MVGNDFMSPNCVVLGPSGGGLLRILSLAHWLVAVPITRAFTFASSQPSTSRHIGVTKVAGLAEQRRSALVLGELKQVAKLLPKLGAALDLLG